MKRFLKVSLALAVLVSFLFSSVAIAEMEKSTMDVWVSLENATEYMMQEFGLPALVYQVTLIDEEKSEEAVMVSLEDKEVFLFIGKDAIWVNFPGDMTNIYIKHESLHAAMKLLTGT